MQRAAHDYVITRNKANLAEYEREKSEFDETTAALKLLAKTPAQQQNLSEISELGARIDTFNRRLISLVNSGNVDQAIKLWKGGESRELAEQLHKLGIELGQGNEEIERHREKVVAGSLQLLNTSVYLGNFLSAILALAIGLWIASIISKAVNKTVSQVANSSTEIAATVEQQERTVTQQASSVNQTTTTMDELGASSRQSAEQAEASASGARQALALAEEGTLSVRQTLNEMSSVKESVEALAEQILRLSEQTNQIGGISGLVGDLANQTNMLALNAAVEAARAGEHGKGFGVVAGEIRKLADQSKKSAQKIDALVADIQSAINITVMVTDSGTKKVDKGMQLVQGTAETFTGVADSINNVFLNSQQISLSAKQQAIAIQQGIDVMNIINLGAKESASGISQVKASTQQLNDAAQNLKALV